MKKIVYLAPLALLGIGAKASANEASTHISKALEVYEEQDKQDHQSVQNEQTNSISSQTGNQPVFVKDQPKCKGKQNSPKSEDVEPVKISNQAIHISQLDEGLINADSSVGKDESNVDYRVSKIEGVNEDWQDPTKQGFHHTTAGWTKLQQNKQASSTQQVGTAETGQTKQLSLPATNLPNDQAIKKNDRLNATHISRLDSSFIDQNTLKVTTSTKPVTSNMVNVSLAETHNGYTADKFAAGTHWTNVGWTRSTSPIAKSVTVHGLNINAENGSIENIRHIGFSSLDFTIEQNQMKRGNRILLAAFQNIPLVGKQSVDLNHTTQMAWDHINQNHDIDYQGQRIGHLEFTGDSSECDIYLNVDKTLTLATDPTFSYTNGENAYFEPNAEWNRNWNNAGGYENRKNNLQYPLKFQILGPNGYKQNVEYTNAKDYYFSNGDIYKIANYYRDGYHQYTGKSFSGYLNDYSFALKTTDKLFDANTAIHTAINVEQFIPIYNSRNQYSTSNLYVTDKPIGYWEQKDDNLTVNDLWQKTLEGHFAFSKQIDGSVIWVVKPTKEQMSIDRNTYYDKIDRSYLANVQDPQHADDYLNASMKNFDQHQGLPSVCSILWNLNNKAASLKKSNIFTAIEVTPDNIDTIYTNKKLVSDYNPVNGVINAELEFYRNASVKYVDDDNHELNLNSDSIIGRKNKPTEYTVHLPHNLVLSSNNPNGKNWVWSADHKTITYIFQDDQNKNDADPIIIHVSHQIKHVDDPSTSDLKLNATKNIHLVNSDKTTPIGQTASWGIKYTKDLYTSLVTADLNNKKALTDPNDFKNDIHVPSLDGYSLISSNLGYLQL